MLNEFHGIPGSGVGQSAGNAGERPAAYRLASDFGGIFAHSLLKGARVVAIREQGEGGKLAPPSPAQRAEGAGGVGVWRAQPAGNLIPIGTSFRTHFEGTTIQCVENDRKLNRIKQVHQVADSMAKAGRESESKALLCCGQWFKKRVFHPIGRSCGTIKLLPCYCDSVFCPTCAGRRALPLQKRILDRVRAGMDYWHLTVTVKNWDSLTKKKLSGLIKQFAKLRKNDLWDGRITGGVYSVECTYNVTEKTWHPHLHVLIETEGKLPFDWIHKLKVAWRGITGDSDVLHLVPMYGKDKKGRKTRGVNMRALKELVKYVTKSAQFGGSPELVAEFMDAFKNTRRIQAFGSFVGMAAEAEKEAAEESNPKPNNPVGCNCGLCVWADGVDDGIVSIRDTKLMPDGSREFAPWRTVWHDGIPDEPPEQLSVF